VADEYTPTTEEIRDYVEVGGEPRPWMPPEPAKDAARAAAFDRWLAAHDAEIRRDQTEKDATELARMSEDWQFAVLTRDSEQQRADRLDGLLRAVVRGLDAVKVSLQGERFALHMAGLSGPVVRLDELLSSPLFATPSIKPEQGPQQ